jgi:excisionase family DNA binding protein
MPATEGSALLLTIGEGARRLGLSERSLWNRVRAGEIPVVKLGRLRRIRTADLEAFVDGLPVAEP